MKIKKAIIITIISLIILILTDFLLALTLNTSPLIKRRDNISKDNLLYIDKGLFTNTYKCQNQKTKTYLKNHKYSCPLKDKKSNMITVTFDTKGGSKVDSITLKNGEKLVLPKDPVYDGYIFKGWVDKNETPIYNEVLLSEDTTLYATYEKNK